MSLDGNKNLAAAKFVLAFLMLLTLGTVLWLANLMHHRKAASERWLAAARWPEVNVDIQNLQVKQHARRKQQDLFSLAVSYRYQFNGALYLASRMAFEEIMFYSRSEAEAAMRSVLASPIARVNANDPREAVLEAAREWAPAGPSASLYWITIGSAAGCVMAVLLAAWHFKRLSEYLARTRPPEKRKYSI